MCTKTYAQEHNSIFRNSKKLQKKMSMNRIGKSIVG